MKRKQKKLIILLFVCFGIPGLQAQEAVMSAGGDAGGSGGNISYSLGQVAYLSVSNTTCSVNQGVQQPYELFFTRVNETNDNRPELLIYPNPTSTNVTLSSDYRTLENRTYQFFNTNGKLLFNQKVTEKRTLIPMEWLPASTYILKVIENEKEVKTFKIIKNY